MLEFLQAYWPEIKEFFNSVFFTAIAGSLAGAFAGAYGAQLIAERAKYREELLEEIRNTNAAISLAFGVCNSLLGIKDQHVKRLKETFDAQKAEVLAFHQAVKAGKVPAGSIFRFVADLQTLSLMPLPVDVLQNLVVERLLLVGRPISLATTLSQTVHGLGAMLEKRNQLIESYKARELEVPSEIYFGLPHRGHVNEDYPSTIRAIYEQTDNGIYFSQLLCKDLVEYGEKVVARFNKRFRKGAPRITRPDFSKAEKNGLMPNADNYTDWVSAFVKASEMKEPLLVRLFPTFARAMRSVRGRKANET